MRYDKLLADKNVLIAGEATDLRRAMASLFAAHGAAVALLGGPQEACDDEEPCGGPQMLRFPADMGNAEEVERACRALLLQWDRADVLVNFFTAHSPGLAHEMTEEALLSELHRGPQAAFLCTKHVVPGMMAQQRGSIVHVLPVYALHTVPGVAATASAAGGVYALSKSIAMDYCRFDIRSNCLIYSASFLDGARGARVDTQPIPRRGAAEEIAGAALYLASDMSKHVTGETLMADGGATLIAHKQILA